MPQFVSPADRMYMASTRPITCGSWLAFAKQKVCGRGSEAPSWGARGRATACW